MLNLINIAQAHTGEVGTEYGMHDFGMMGGAWPVLGFIMWASVLALVVLGVIAFFKYVFGDKHVGNSVGARYHVCPKCGFEYEDKEWADKCYEWCSKNKSCNIEITKHSRQHKHNK